MCYPFKTHTMNEIPLSVLELAAVVGGNPGSTIAIQSLIKTESPAGVALILTLVLAHALQL